MSLMSDGISQAQCWAQTWCLVMLTKLLNGRNRGFRSLADQILGGKVSGNRRLYFTEDLPQALTKLSNQACKYAGSNRSLSKENSTANALPFQQIISFQEKHLFWKIVSCRLKILLVSDNVRILFQFLSNKTLQKMLSPSVCNIALNLFTTS